MKRNLARIIKISLVLLSFNILAAAQTSVVPFVFFNSEDNADEPLISSGNLLGGVENGKYLDAKTTFGKLKGGEKFSLLNFESGKKGEYLIGDIKPYDGVCPDTYFVEPQLKVSADLAVGANAGWQIFPRQPTKVDLTDAAHKKVVSEVLTLRGLTKIPSKIIQAFRVDLDGDGREEVVLTASHRVEDSNQEPTIGSYSFIIIRKTVGGKTQNLFVGGYFMTKKEALLDGDYSLSGIADLNGDGRLELFVEVVGYEENWIKVYEMKAGKPAEIKALAYYCGA